MFNKKLFLFIILFTCLETLKAQVFFSEQEHPIAITSYLPNGIHLADIDNDSDLDMLTTSLGDRKIAWYDNVGNKNFVPRQILCRDIQLTNEARLIDLENDSDVDVVGIFAFTQEIYQMKNNGFGLFDSAQVLFTASEVPVDLFVEDINGDGYKDLVLMLQTLELVWYTNDGSGNFGEEQYLMTIESDILRPTFADMNNDGLPEMLFIEDNKVKIKYNIDGISFSTQTIETMEGAYALTCGDLTNDGFLDIVVHIWVSNELKWLINNGDNTFEIALPLVTTTQLTGITPYLTDLDSDNDLDILCTNSNPIQAEISWFSNEGGGVFGPEIRIDSLGAQVIYLAPADVDGDGDMDMAAAAEDGNWPPSEDAIVWYENDGTQIFSKHNVNEMNDGITLNFGQKAHISPNDLDNDGDIDFVRADSQYGKLAWYNNLGNGDFVENIIYRNGSENYFNVQTYDIDNDNDNDIILQKTSELVAFFNNGTAIFSAPENIASGGGFWALADINQDSYADILMSREEMYGNSFCYVINDGTGHFSAEDTLQNSPDGHTNFAVGDFDNDNDLDLITAGGTWGLIDIYTNQGDGNFSAPQNIGTYNGIWAASVNIEVADFNSDNIVDFLFNYGCGLTEIYFNNGDATFIPQSYPTLYSCNANLVDMDNDGDIDILGGTSISPPTWYENDGWGNFTEHVIVQVDYSWNAEVLAADVDGDGDQDPILLYSMPVNMGISIDIVWYENTLLSSNENPLPITLLNFKGVPTSNANLLTWTSTAEVNCNYYTIYESNTGTENSYKPVAQIKANGTSSSIRTYNYEHLTTAPLTYYKLSQTDYDQQEVKLANIAVQRNTPNTANAIMATLAPNPTPNFCTLTINSLPQNIQKINIDIVGMEGDIKLQQTFETNKHNLSPTLFLDLQNLQIGIYLLHVTDEKGQSLCKNKLIKIN